MFASHHRKAFDAYGSATETIPAGRQIVMLYDGMIRRMEEARQACLDGRIEERWRATQKAVRICDALHASLDHDHGGTAAPVLARWYAMIAVKMHQINASSNSDRCTEIIGLLRDMRSSWDEICQKQAPSPTLGVPTVPASSGLHA